MTREEAYIGGQKLQTYKNSEDNNENYDNNNDGEFFPQPVFTTPPDKDHKTICNKKVE